MLNNTFPVNGYHACTITKIHLTGDYTLSDFDNFNISLLQYCLRKKIVFPGIVMDPGSDTYTVYLYSDSPESKKYIERYFRRHLTFPFEINAYDDPDWNIFKDDLAPSDPALIRLHNRYIISNLAKNDFDFSSEISIVFTAVFEEQQNALDFLEVVAPEYEQTLYTDNTEFANENNLTKKYHHLALLQKSFRISEAWLDIRTLNLYHLAKEHDGEYEFIQIGKINGNNE